MENIEIYSDLHSLSQNLAEEFVGLVDETIRTRGIFSAALAGGNTPRPFYRALGSPERRDRIDWWAVHLFWGDERCVPPAHPESNYRMVREELLDKISITEENIHRAPAELAPKLAADKYEETLRSFFSNGQPRFDMVLLGMGDDGHTASLFPHSLGLQEEQRWFIPNKILGKDEWRLTLTKRAINIARKVWVIVSGKSKADMLAEVLMGKVDPKSKPIQLIAPVDGEMTWFVDQDAARSIE